MNYEFVSLKKFEAQVQPNAFLQPSENSERPNAEKTFAGVGEARAFGDEVAAARALAEEIMGCAKRGHDMNTMT